MQLSIYNIVTAALEADSTLSDSDKAKILAVCKNPGHFTRPTEVPLPQLLTSKEVEGILKTSKSSLRRMIDAGDIPRVQLQEKQLRFRVEDVREYIERSREKT